jgi:hypothetical protein
MMTTVRIHCIVSMAGDLKMSVLSSKIGLMVLNSYPHLRSLHLLYLLFYMGVKLSLPHCGKTIDRWCLRTKFEGKYLDLKERQ